MIKIVIFDFDGTIGDTLPLCIEAFHRAIEPLAGKTLTDEEIVNTFGPSEEGTIKALIPGAYEQGVKAYLSWYKELHRLYPHPFKGIKEVIEYLRSRHILVALVTGKGKNSCRISLEQYQMEKSFDLIKTGSPDGDCKEQGMQDVLQQAGIRPDQALYVGDTASDILHARNVGLPIASALWGSVVDEEEVCRLRPEYMFFSVEEFRDFIEKQERNSGK